MIVRNAQTVPTLKFFQESPTVQTLRNPSRHYRLSSDSGKIGFVAQFLRNRTRIQALLNWISGPQLEYIGQWQGSMP